MNNSSTFSELWYHLIEIQFKITAFKTVITFDTKLLYKCNFTKTYQ